MSAAFDEVIHRVTDRLSTHPGTRDPNRLWCPGCLSVEPLEPSPMPKQDCDALGLLPIWCRNCGMHVWKPKGELL